LGLFHLNFTFILFGFDLLGWWGEVCGDNEDDVEMAGKVERIDNNEDIVETPGDVPQVQVESSKTIKDSQTISWST
jgi:hypothetical protein